MKIGASGWAQDLKWLLGLGLALGLGWFIRD